MRITILGNAGSGKSTLAIQLSRTLNLPAHEMDALLWTEGWVAVPENVFADEHDRLCAANDWIIEGLGHKETIARRVNRATHVILCDFPLWQHYWLLAERQIKWAAGTLELRPGGLETMPPTSGLFETVWTVDRDWMPMIRDLVAAAEKTKPVFRIDSFEELTAFEFPQGA